MNSLRNCIFNSQRRHDGLSLPPPTGYIAQSVENRTIFASTPDVEILLHVPNDIVYVWLKNARYCTAYAGAAVRPTTLVPPPVNFLNQYFCQWLNPSPCSWGSVSAFYSSLVHAATGAYAA